MKFERLMHFSLLAVPVLVLPAVSHAATINVACPGQLLQTAVTAAAPGDTINVTGTCTENVLIRNEKLRFTIDGGNTATINGGASGDALEIKGKGIAVQNITITGGGVGIEIDRAASAQIIHSVIHNASSDGILVHENAFAAIYNSTIQNNGGYGIDVNELASARIGFNQTTDSAASPNIISNNTSGGILVTRSAVARIVGNTIQNNGGDGIAASRGSHADIASNVINGNGTSFVVGSGSTCCNGVKVTENSSINLGEDSASNFLGQPNTTTVKNANYGLYCSLGGAIYGHWGTVGTQLDGNTAQSSISGTCPNDILTP